MKNLIKIVVILFIFFLSTPTIISLFEEKIDTTIFYGMSEEEQNDKEFKSDCIFYYEAFHFNLSKEIKIKINTLPHLNHTSISSKIVIPPPEFM